MMSTRRRDNEWRDDIDQALAARRVRVRMYDTNWNCTADTDNNEPITIDGTPIERVEVDTD